MADAITHLLGNSLLAEFNWDQLDQHRVNLINYCLQRAKPNTVESNIAPHAKSNLWESKFDFLEDNDPDIIAVKLWITEVCEQYVNQLNRSNYKFIITDSWAHVTEQHGYHLPHYHSNSTWSGIIYIDVNPNSSGKNHWLVPYNLERKPGLEFIKDSYSSEAVPGKMILFPSMITHYAEPYTGITPRIIIAFNAICR